MIVWDIRIGAQHYTPCYYIRTYIHRRTQDTIARDVHSFIIIHSKSYRSIVKFSQCGVAVLLCTAIEVLNKPTVSECVSERATKWTRLCIWCVDKQISCYKLKELCKNRERQEDIKRCNSMFGFHHNFISPQKKNSIIYNLHRVNESRDDHKSIATQNENQSMVTTNSIKTKQKNTNYALHLLLLQLLLHWKFHFNPIDDHHNIFQTSHIPEHLSHKFYGVCERPPARSFNGLYNFEYEFNFRTFTNSISMQR